MPSGPRTWLLLRGLARETAHWGAFIGDLHREFPEDEIKTLDLPGAGMFNNICPPLSISGFVNFLRRQLEKDPPKYPLHLISVSLGGMVALEWMNQYPTQIRGGVLINSSLANLCPFYKRLRWENYVSFLTRTMYLKGCEREKAILKVISNRGACHEAVAKEWEEILQKRPLKFQYVARQLLAASHYRLKSKPPVPTLILVGLGDHLVHPDCSTALHKEFDLPIEKHPWGGHDLTLDDGPWVAQKVKNWAQGL